MKYKLRSKTQTVFHNVFSFINQDKSASVSCVCLHNGLDHLVAIGYMSGEVYLFQLPSMLIGHSKQVGGV